MLYAKDLYSPFETCSTELHHRLCGVTAPFTISSKPRQTCLEFREFPEEIVPNQEPILTKRMPRPIATRVWCEGLELCRRLKVRILNR